MVDYSKWDSVQLSDDSDIEVHPNVDKRSFIRAKQQQIHMERQQRKIEIEALKYDRTVNSTLSKRISALLANLTEHKDVDASSTASVVFQAVMKTAPPDMDDDKPPTRPEGVFKDDQPPAPSYSRMLVSLFDEINKKLDADSVQPDERYNATIKELNTHYRKIQDLQQDVNAKLTNLEAADTARITSDSYHIGFDSSHVTKTKPVAEKSTSKIELLNPGVRSQTTASDASCGETVQAQEDGDDAPNASSTAKAFARIPVSDYRASRAFISTHPEILQEAETDGLLAEALTAAYENSDNATIHQFVHQALLLQYCRLLGPNGVDMFFKSAVDPNHQAKQMFHKDVAEQVNRIQEFASKRAKELAEGQEQIQIQAVEPGTSIHIRIPDATSDDEQNIRARSIFDHFTPEIKAALQSGSLDNVNKVLGKMDITEAEDLIGLLGDAGCLDINRDVVDTTTEQGRRRISDMAT